LRGKYSFGKYKIMGRKKVERRKQDGSKIEDRFKVDSSKPEGTGKSL